MRWPLLLVVLLTMPVQAAVYTYVDGNGNRVYTDQPRKGAQRMDLPTPSPRVTSPAPRPQRTAPAAAPAARPAAPVRYQMLRILLPLPDTAVREENGQLIVTLTSDPGLQQGHRYRLLLDGKVAGESARSPVFALSNVDRGTHSLAAEIVDYDDYVIERTPPQPVHLQRISLIQKRRMHPCKTADYGVRPECPLTDKPDDD